MKYCCLPIAFTILCAGKIAAQTTQPSNYNNWFTYFAQYKLHQNWAVHLDLQFRADDKVQRINQSLLRAGVQYLIRPDLNATLGYAYINTFSEGASAYFTEHRIWQQLLYNQAFGKMNMTHRLRLEQRWVEIAGSEPDEYHSGHRLRYFNRTIFPLHRKERPKAAPYFALQNEIFFNFASPDINRNVPDQNRLLLAVGILHQKQTRLEIGYMNQWLNPASGDNTTKHILHFSVLQVLDFSAAGS